MSEAGSDIVFRENPLVSSRGLKYPDFSFRETMSAYSFHRSIPSFGETPLYEMKGLASYLGLSSLWIKDESQRFRLGSFKALGASYALAKWLNRKAGISGQPTFDRLVWWFNRLDHNFTLVTATDGNHGYGVAWLAHLCNCSAMIFVPENIPESRIAGIRKLGAEVISVNGNYDKAVRLAKEATSSSDSLFIQNTTTAYEDETVSYIMQGYLTLIHETYEQLPLDKRPDHILIQAGSGSFAAAVQAYLKNRFREKAPQVLLVEPEGSDGFSRSFGRGDGNLSRLDDYDSVMTELNCGEPSRRAWKILREETRGVLSCHNRVAGLGMRVLNQPISKDPRIISGESGAVGLGALFKICREQNKEDIRKNLGITDKSRVLVFSTEGAMDPDGFRRGLWEEL